MAVEFNEVFHEFDFEGSKVSFDIGKIARRSNSAVFARMGETVVLATVDISDPMEGSDYFPLNVEYIERLYAGGVISSSRFVKREGHPSEDATLTARMIDRSIRSRFPSDYRNQVQVIVTVLSYDSENDPKLLAFSAVSAALMLSKAPFEGPTAGMRVGYDGEKVMVCNKDLAIEENADASKMNYVLGTDGSVVTMIDADAQIVDEQVIIDAMNLGVEKSRVLIDGQNEFVEKVKESRGGSIFKAEYESFATPKDLISEVRKNYKSKIEEILFSGDSRAVREGKLEDLKEKLFEENEGTYSKSEMAEAFDYLSKGIVQTNILEDNRRSDGRALDEIRPLHMEVGILPKTHGSTLFTRGGTQAITVATLGSRRLAQLMEGMEGEKSKSYMHHYNAPNFTVGETGRFRYYPGRREVGHGALAEKALLPVIPSKDEFPYTIRVVSDIMSQAGSSSMASTCGSTLALMDAGVPIKSPVAGIAMGVIVNEDASKWVVLTDIAEYEDFYGHMDFKVTGTKDGVTAIQMDNKKKGLPVEIFTEAIGKAKDARLFLLGEMEKVIDKPSELSKNAPRIDIIEINKDKIGELIGPGGKNIKGIIEETGADIEVDDSGKVTVASSSEESRKKALEMIDGSVGEAEIGKVYTGTVAKIMDFGAFVDVTPAISGLVHVSEMADDFVKDPNDIVSEGQEVKVKVIGIDDRGRVKMSMKQVD